MYQSAATYIRQAMGIAKRSGRTVRVHVKHNPEPGVKYRISFRTDEQSYSEDEFGPVIAVVKPDDTFHCP